LRDHFSPGGQQHQGKTGPLAPVIQFGRERAGRVLSRETLADLVRSDSAQAYDPALDRSIDVHIARIRAAIEDDPKHPRRILTVRGVGYVFAKAQS
jgi:DNA-binding response OmpR family regulator